jgi:hypothetical protein
MYAGAFSPLLLQTRTAIFNRVRMAAQAESASELI